MTVIGVQPIMLKGATFTVAADDYTAAVTQAVFTPQPSWSWVRGWDSYVTPAVAGPVLWTVSLGFIQDLVTASSLSSYLLTNLGELKTVTFTPAAGGSTVTASVMILPGQIGGVPNQQMTAAVTLPVVGEPTVT